MVAIESNVTIAPPHWPIVYKYIVFPYIIYICVFHLYLGEGKRQQKKKK